MLEVSLPQYSPSDKPASICIGWFLGEYVENSVFSFQPLKWGL